MTTSLPYSASAARFTSATRPSSMLRCGMRRRRRREKIRQNARRTRRRGVRRETRSRGKRRGHGAWTHSERHGDVLLRGSVDCACLRGMASAAPRGFIASSGRRAARPERKYGRLWDESRFFTHRSINILLRAGSLLSHRGTRRASCGVAARASLAATVLLTLLASVSAAASGRRRRRRRRRVVFRRLRRARGESRSRSTSNPRVDAASSSAAPTPTADEPPRGGRERALAPRRRDRDAPDAVHVRRRGALQRAPRRDECGGRARRTARNVLDEPALHIATRDDHLPS